MIEGKVAFFSCLILFVVLLSLAFTPMVQNLSPFSWIANFYSGAFLGSILGMIIWGIVWIVQSVRKPK